MSAELAEFYDFSDMPEKRFDGTEQILTTFTAYVTVKEASESPVAQTISSLPVRYFSGGGRYGLFPAPELSATLLPDTAVTVGEFNQWQGLAIDYYNPMVDAELSEGYDIQAGYTVSIPLTDYEGRNPQRNSDDSSAKGV